VKGGRRDDAIDVLDANGFEGGLAEVDAPDAGLRFGHGVQSPAEAARSDAPSVGPRQDRPPRLDEIRTGSRSVNPTVISGEARCQQSGTLRQQMQHISATFRWQRRVDFSRNAM